MSIVTTEGPLFTSEPTRVLKEMGEESERAVGIIGASMVRTELNNVLRVQTPVYRLKVEAVADRPGWKIWDQKWIYGPWLEGTGSRNRTTRFKGYFTFRRMTPKIQARAQVIADGVVRRLLERLR